MSRKLVSYTALFLATVAVGAALETVLTAGDSGGPATVITQSPPTGPKIDFSATEESTFECSLDGQPWETCQSGHIWEGHNPGVHQLEVRATDASGNTDSTPAIHTWTVPTPGTLNKTAQISMAVDPSQSINARATVSVDPIVTSVRWSVDNVLKKTQYTPPYTYLNLPTGEHSVSAKAVVAGDDSYAIAKQRYIK